MSANSGKQFGGLMIMSIGGMVALLCGVCTLSVGFDMITSMMRLGTRGEPPWALLLPLVIGGIPTAIGSFVFLIGLKIVRESSPVKRNPR